MACQSLTPTKPLQPAVAIRMPEKVSEIIRSDCLGPLPRGMNQRLRFQLKLLQQ